jgi:hypothetical protein
VPVQLSISNGRMFLREGKPLMETVIAQARDADVPVHTMIRLDRHVDRAIVHTARERKVDLMILGWPGGSDSTHTAFGSVIDLVAKNPPCDTAVVRFRKRQDPRRILVPTSGGANTRLAISNTAEVLGHGQWEFAAKQIAGLFELSVGLGNRFQLSFKSSPPTWFIPGLKLKDALWAGEIRAQLVRSRLFKLTADAAYFHVSELNGLKLGLSAKYGTDKLALHVGVGAVLLFPPRMTADTCGGPVSNEDGSYDSSYDCGGGSYNDAKPMTILTANLGLEARFWRYGKFFLDTFVAHMATEGEQLTIFALVPGVRFHGKGFAADLGLGVLGVGEFKIPLPVVNLSYRW